MKLESSTKLLYLNSDITKKAPSKAQSFVYTREAFRFVKILFKLSVLVGLSFSQH